MNGDRIRKYLDVIDNCTSRQNELYRISGKYGLESGLFDQIDSECDRYQEIIESYEDMIRKEIK